MEPEGKPAPPSKFQNAMRSLLEQIPEEQLKRFHPYRGAVDLWHNRACHNVFPVTPDNNGKDAEQSANYRQQGNDLFKKKKFDEALEKFNISLMYAPFPIDPSKIEKDTTDKTKAKTNDDGVKPHENGVNDQVNNYEDVKEVDATDVSESNTNKKRNRKGKKKKNVQENTADNSNMPLNGKLKDEDNNTNLAMAYVVANRSACLFFLGSYAECIDDINLAFKLGYPDDLAYKLFERKAKCLVQMSQGNEAIEYLQKATMSVADAKLDEKAKQNVVFALGKQIKRIKDGKDLVKQSKEKIRYVTDTPPLSGTKSEIYNCTSDVFHMAQDDVRGRHVIANGDIAIGDVITCEVPYSSVLYPEYYQTHCNRCLTRVIVATPCRQCSTVMYCSSFCEEEAWTSFHQVECPVLSWLDPTWIGRLGHLALRTVLVAGYTQLKTYYCNDSDAAKLERISPFRKDGTYSTGYSGVFHLVANLTSRSSENIFNFSLLTVLMIKIFFTGVACVFRNEVNAKKNLFTTEQQGNSTAPNGNDHKNVSTSSGGPSEKQLEVLSFALVHHLQIIQCNGFAIPEMQGKEDFRTFVPRDVGLGLFTVHGLLNHSCDPEVDLCFYGNAMVARAIKNIRKGKEICVDYGVLYFTQPKDMRMATLSSQYYFECNCRPCLEDWPLWQDIEATTPTFRCGGCKEPLPSVGPMMGGNLPSHIQCICGHETAVLKNLAELNESHQRYAIAMKLKAETNNGSVLKALIQHLHLMDCLICPPWREYVSCQSSIKQSFRLLGNWFRVRGDIIPAE